ncbi:RsmE family RNA methyltransferase, partial [Paraburkholderia tropica]|uniref:RsmE family RNA methyltransferase n=1 Tax=Paraburkholderia tropica TaxID=92647 RepID=UPI001591287C
CGRNRVPAVAAVSDYAAWLAALPSPVEDEVRLMLSPRASIAFAELPEQAPTGEIRLLIGPEGGLSPAEEDAARECGFRAIVLGARVLRTETAGMAMLAAMAARWGGW